MPRDPIVREHAQTPRLLRGRRQRTNIDDHCGEAARNKKSAAHGQYPATDRTALRNQGHWLLPDGCERRPRLVATDVWERGWPTGGDEV